MRKSDRRRAEQTLKKPEECYRAAVEHCNDGVAIIRDEMYVFVNQKFLEMFGYQTSEELLGRRVTDAAVHLPHEDRERLREMDRRTQKGEPPPSRYEFKGIRKDGTVLYVEASIASIVYQAKPSLLACLRDITEHKRAELRLRDSEKAMRSLLNATNDLALLVDIKGTIIAANDVVAERLGKEVEDLIGQNIFDFFPKGAAQRRESWVRKVVETGKPVRDEDTSDDRYFDSCVYPIFDAEGSVVRVAIHAKDITEIKLTGRRLAENEARFRQLLDSVNDGIVVRDAGTFELLDANRRFCEMWGYTFTEMKALPLGSLGAHKSVEERRERLIANYAQVANGTPSLVQFPAKRKDGSTFWCELNVTRIAIGTQECLLSVARDITERRKAEEALKRSEEAALRLAQETGVIAEVGRIISSSLDIEEVYERFAEEVRKLIPFDRILVNLVNQHNGTLITAYTAGIEVAGRTKGVVFPIAGSVTEEMIRTGKPVLFHPESVEEVYNRFPGLALTFQASLRSRLSVPLIARGEVIGSLALWSRQVRAYGERDIWLAQGVASQIAGAIANAELFRERKRVEEALRESEESYRSLVQTSPDAIFLHDQGRFVYLNPASVRLFGAGSAEEMYGKNALDFVDSDYRASMENRIQFITATGAPVPLKETRMVRCDGSTVDVEASAGVSYYQGKKVIQVIQRDITERKKSDQALRESEERYRTAIEHSNDGVVITRDGRYVYINERFLDLFGYEGPEKVLGTSIADARHVHPQDREKMAQTFRRRQAGEAPPSRYEYRAVHKDGRDLHVEASATRIVYQGEPAYLAYLRDITERKRAEETLREERQRLAGIIKGTNVGTWEWNVQTGETVFNDRWAEIIGYTLEEISPVSIETWMKFAHPDDLKASDELIEKHFRGELDYYEFESRMKHKDGNWVWVLDRGRVTAWTEDGKPLLMSGTHQDITERKQAEEKIRASLKEKEVLLKEIHHRVKNNLQIMSSLLFLQSSRTEHPGAVSALMESRNRIKSMALIHERLYQSPSLASVDMGEYTRNLVSDLHHFHRREDSSVRLTLNLENISLGITEAIPCGLIINELVSNALKHAFPKGKGGEITVELQRGATNQVALTVSDNGIGFPEHVDFRKSASLGLTLINSLVEQLEGAIELDQSGGTTFTITFKVSG